MADSAGAMVRALMRCVMAAFIRPCFAASYDEVVRRCFCTVIMTRMSRAETDLKDGNRGEQLVRSI